MPGIKRGHLVLLQSQARPFALTYKAKRDEAAGTGNRRAIEVFTTPPSPHSLQQQGQPDELLSSSEFNTKNTFSPGH